MGRYRPASLLSLQFWFCDLIDDIFCSLGIGLALISARVGLEGRATSLAVIALTHSSYLALDCWQAPRSDLILVILLSFFLRKIIVTSKLFFFALSFP